MSFAIRHLLIVTPLLQECDWSIGAHELATSVPGTVVPLQRSWLGGNGSPSLPGGDGAISFGNLLLGRMALRV